MAVRKLLSVDEAGNEIVRLPPYFYKSVLRPLIFAPDESSTISLRNDVDAYYRLGKSLDTIQDYISADELFLIPKKYYKVKVLTSSFFGLVTEGEMDANISAIMPVQLSALRSDQFFPGLDFVENNILYVTYSNAMPMPRRLTITPALERISYLKDNYANFSSAENGMFYLYLFL